MLHIIFIILIGFLVGLVARWIGPGAHIQGFWITALIGVVGSVLATYGGQALGLYRVGQPAGFIGSVVGAIVLLVLVQLFATLGHAIEEIAVLRHAGRIGLALPARHRERLVGEHAGSPARPARRAPGPATCPSPCWRRDRRCRDRYGSAPPPRRASSPRRGIVWSASPRNSRSSGGMQSGWAATLRSKT